MFILKYIITKLNVTMWKCLCPTYCYYVLIIISCLTLLQINGLNHCMDWMHDGKTEVKLKHIGLWTELGPNAIICFMFKCCYGKIIFPFIWPVILWKPFIPCSLIAFCALTKNKWFKQLIVPFIYRIDKKVGWTEQTR